MIDPDCHEIDDSAIACGNISRGTRLGASAWNAGPEKLRATPSSAATTYSAVSVVVPCHANQPSAAAQPSSSRIVPRPTQRRSK